MNSSGREAAIRGGGTRRRIFVARFHAILRSRNYLCGKSPRTLASHRHDLRSGYCNMQQSIEVAYRDAILRPSPSSGQATISSQLRPPSSLHACHSGAALAGLKKHRMPSPITGLCHSRDLSMAILSNTCSAHWWLDRHPVMAWGADDEEELS